VQHNNIFTYSLGEEHKGRLENKMEMSIKDRLIILAMSITGIIILLLIAYDPLDILDTTQKYIIAAIYAIVIAPILLIYQVQRIRKKMKKTT
jgi:hypothetical protein